MQPAGANKAAACPLTATTHLVAPFSLQSNLEIVYRTDWASDGVFLGTRLKRTLARLLSSGL